MEVDIQLFKVTELWADLEIGMVSLQRYFDKLLEKLNINNEIYLLLSSSTKENNFSTIFKEACLSSLD